MKTALAVILTVAVGLGLVGVPLGQMNPANPENSSGGMMGGGQIGQMMHQMSAMIAQQGTPQQQPSQAEKK